MKHINKECNHCKVNLVLDDNYARHRLRKKDYICKTCYNEYQLTNTMFVNGKYVSSSHVLFKPGRYKTFEDAAFSSLAKYEKTPEGDVYIIVNPAWKGWIKIGMAIDAEDRCSRYQTSSPLRDYTLKFKKFFKYGRKAERAAHKLVGKKSKERNGEWFKFPVLSAQKIIEAL